MEIRKIKLPLVRIFFKFEIHQSRFTANEKLFMKIINIFSLIVIVSMAHF